MNYPTDSRLGRNRLYRALMTGLATLICASSSFSSAGHLLALPSASPFSFTRSLPGRGNPFSGHKPINTKTDFNNDGVYELAVGQATFDHSEVLLLDGVTGARLKRFRGPGDASSNFIDSLGISPDLDNDGTSDFLVGDPLLFPNRQGRVFSFFSGGNDGLIQQSGVLNYEIPGPGPGGGFGNDTAVLGDVAAIAWSDEGRVLLVDVASGATVAKVSASNSGLGFSVFNIGDVDGDNIDDLLTSNPNTGPGPGRGEIYVLSGALTTSGESYVPINSLPDGGLIATINNQGPDGVFLGSSRKSPYANLGDPFPLDGLRSSLIVSGGADGLVVHLLTPDPNGVFSVQQVAGVNQQTSDLIRVRDVSNVGDVNNDGLEDFALLEDFNDRVLVISGMGLLDGFQESDVLQQIDPLSASDQLVALQSLGDYDTNGSFDIVIGTQVSGSAANIRYDVYSFVIPEPTTFLLAVLTSVGLLKRRTRDSGTPPNAEG